MAKQKEIPNYVLKTDHPYWIAGELRKPGDVFSMGRSDELTIMVSEGYAERVKGEH